MELSRTIDSDKRYYLDENTIDSQKELKKYYSTTITAYLKTRDEKIKMIQEALDKKKAVKNSIRIYRKDGRWVTPYPRCQLKVKGLMIVLFNNINKDDKKPLAMSFYPQLRAF